MDHEQYARHRRNEASTYLKIRWGIDRKPATLSKYASVGGGPKLEYAGRVPLYPQHELDAWAHSILSPERGEVNGARAIMASRQESSDSLDNFPTPPWATRALFEHVLPSLGIRNYGSIWEPACGEGHIAEVLREYCSDVLATDIRDYGHGQVADFLTQADIADWIITNPPFGGKSTAFVLRALDFTNVGVAMFLRSQWAVEGIDRYERIFRDRPPTLCAFFSERVPLCKGRWDPDGSTATAYCWLVWVHSLSPRPPLWIPPGCRDALTRPDDRERFTAHPVKAGRTPSSTVRLSTVREAALAWMS